MLLRILDRYLEHLRGSPSSLLVRYLGLHTLTMHGRSFAFVVMKNVFPLGPMNERFDIKVWGGVGVGMGVDAGGINHRISAPTVRVRVRDLPPQSYFPIITNLLPTFFIHNLSILFYSIL